MPKVKCSYGCTCGKHPMGYKTMEWELHRKAVIAAQQARAQARQHPATREHKKPEARRPEMQESIDDMRGDRLFFLSEMGY